MPFLDEVDELKRKLPRGRLSAPVLVGIGGVVALVLASVVVTQAGSPGFVVEQSQAQESVSDAGDAAGGGDPVPGQGSSSASVPGASASGDAAAAQAQPPESCYVYVVGAVRKAGVYQLPSTARVNDAVAAAGGFAEDAAVEAVNLARVVQDGEQITIPTQQQVEAGAFGQQAPDGVSVGGLQAGDAGMADAGGGGKVNLNTASSQELQQLDGIGEVTAEKIIASREQEGPFQTIEDLKRVSGIGDKKYAAIEGDITV